MEWQTLEEPDHLGPRADRPSEQQVDDDGRIYIIEFTKRRLRNAQRSNCLRPAKRPCLGKAGLP